VLVATFSPLAAIFGPCVVRVRPRALLPGDTEFGGPPQAAARGGHSPDDKRRVMRGRLSIR
jgi:hypothetical protein